jgi:hypothetical protein
MLRKLDPGRIGLLREYCLGRFGIGQERLENYKWYIGSKNRVYIGPEELERINPESIGICIFRLDRTPKPTTNFLQFFGRYITKNIIEIKRNEAIEYCNGKNLDPGPESDVDPGFVAVRYKNRFLGCGHWDGNMLKNQIPKSRFCKLRFL